MDAAIKTFPVQRRYKRVRCNAAAVVTSDGQTFSGICESLSVGGAFFKGPVAPPSSEVRMVLCLPSMGPIEVVGEVRYARDDGVGICFTQLPTKSLRALCTYLGGTLH